MIVKVIPGARKTEIVGWENDMLKIRIKAAPEKGEANTALIEFLAKILNIPKSWITLVRGHKSRIKYLQFKEVSPSEILKKINDLCSLNS